MFNSIQKEISNFVNRGLDRQLRIAVTGLSRSGKTAFITSLINQLLHINRADNGHLPLFEGARNGAILGVKRVPQQNWQIARFDYDSNLQALQSNPPSWPQSTRGVSETRLQIRYQQRHGLMRHLKETGTLYLDIFDYPGEWLLDLPMLDLSFQQWCEEVQRLFDARRQKLAQNWLNKAQQLDLSAPCNEDRLAQIAKDYSDYLQACKADGLHFIQPGRFVLPGDLEGAPALQFFPLLNLSAEQWQSLQQADSHSYFAVLKQRYDYYRKHIVKGFYQQHFAYFDRQIILADCLTPLNHGEQAFQDMREGLLQLFKNFHYGKRSLLSRLFAPSIDKLLFVASKADHITSDQLPNLISLMRQLVQEGGRYAEFEGIETDYSAIASIRATKQVQVEKQGQIFKALQGVRQQDQQKVTLYPGSVPSKLPSADFWQQQKFEFDQFEPQPLVNGDPIPHLRMDAVLQFLLGDKI